MIEDLFPNILLDKAGYPELETAISKQVIFHGEPSAGSDLSEVGGSQEEHPYSHLWVFPLDTYVVFHSLCDGGIHCNVPSQASGFMDT